MGLGQSLGFINMSIFGRVHKYKECEHWSKIKVWIMSKMKVNYTEEQERPPKLA